MTIPRCRRAAGVACLVAVFSLGACASDDDSGQPTTSTTTTTLTPAAGVDPNADGVLTGPINDARRVAEEAEKRQKEQEQQPQEPAPAPRQQSDPDMSR